MSRTIGDDAIKITLIQTLPGEEFNVASTIESVCVEAKLTKFAIFKGFGSYDIIFFHAWHDFSSVLTKYGPIAGILKTTKSFCYHYLVGDSESFFNKLNEYACAAITIIKISNDDNLCCYASERAIIDEMTADPDALTFFFGTLGWSELIAVTAGNDLSINIKRCLVPSYGKTSKYIQKTYSIIAINYKMLPYKKIATPPTIDDFIELAPSFDSTILKEIGPIITVTCFPGASDELLNFWSKDRYEVYDLIGKEDIQILPIHGIKWINLIHDLFIFRIKYKTLIHSTTTYISYSGDVDRSSVSIAPKPPISLNYNFKSIIDIFNERGLALSNALNTISGLINNNIVCDAFADMVNYSDYIQDFALKMDVNKRHNFSLIVTDIINKSAEIRLYGTYGTIEENVGQFNKLRGGVQRSIQAISFLPAIALKRTLGPIGYTWKGFVSVSNHQFFNSKEVIHVPIESLWNPESWWAINHEVAHIIIDNVYMTNEAGKFESTIVDDKNIQLKMFLASKNNPDHWLQLVVELAAEYIGYELGFYSNYDLFIKKVWLYLKELAPKNLLFSPLSIYAVRTYFVRLFEKVFVNSEMEQSDVSNYDLVYEEIVAHIEDIERIGGRNDSDQFKSFLADKYIIAAYYAPKFKSLLPWMEKILSPAVKDLNCKKNKNELYDSNTNEIFSSLEAGIIWDAEIKYPEAVMYKIYQEEQLSFKMSMATVLSFWNQFKKMRRNHV